MTFGVADVLLSATVGRAVSAAIPGARSADMRSVSRVELAAASAPAAARPAVVSAPGGSPQPSTAIAAPNARGARVQLRRNAIAGVPPLTLPHNRLASPAPPLAMQADLWQGLHTFSSAGPAGRFIVSRTIFFAGVMNVMVAAETFVSELDAKNQPSIQQDRGRVERRLAKDGVEVADALRMR